MRGCINLAPSALLLLALATGAAAAGPAPELEAEAEILRELRQVLLSVRFVGVSYEQHGWRQGDETHHCTWKNVRCSTDGYVTSIAFSSGTVGHAERAEQERAKRGHVAAPRQPLALPASLTRLRRLEELQLILTTETLAGWPDSFIAPGSFPALTSLTVWFACAVAGSPLPDIQPGALPVLRYLTVRSGTPLPLPAQWGRPGVLPALEVLALGVLQPQFPAEWSTGFRRLRVLDLEGSVGSIDRKPCPIRVPVIPACAAASSAAPAAPAQPAAHRLPPEWADGFPALEEMYLHCMALDAEMPRAWQDGGFPSLVKLDVHGLMGTLPAPLVPAHPRLEVLALHEGTLTGTLPGAWASSQLRLIRLTNNALSGPAIPEGWLAPGAMQQLEILTLSGNRGINGTLPGNLAWPALLSLELTYTQVEGTIPEAWCCAPFAKWLQAIRIEGTGIAPRLPRCGRRDAQASSLSRVVLLSEAGYSRQPAQGGGVPARQAALVAALLLAGLPAAAFAAWVLWGPSRLHAHNDGAARVRLLHSMRSDDSAASRAEEGQEGGGELPAAAGQEGGGALLAARGVVSMRSAARMARLRKEVGFAAPVVALVDLGSALAHNLGDKVTTKPRTAWAGQLDPFGRGGLAADGTGDAPRRWGLPTHSLQVGTTELELAVHAGEYVVLGEGQHSTVLLGRLRGTLSVAVKMFDIPTGIESSAVWREACLLRRCAQHPRVVSILGAAAVGPLLLFVMELMPGGSLMTALQDAELKEALRWSARGRQVAVDVAEGLAFLHSQGILWSDCKKQNVLMSVDLRASLGDLGESKVLSAGEGSTGGFTSIYAAPEQLLGKPCTLAADLYGLGILLAEITTQTLCARRGEWHLPRAPDECPAEVVRLIQACVRLDPQARPSAEEALRVLRATPAGS